jgi:hypothetical protein
MAAVLRKKFVCALRAPPSEPTEVQWKGSDCLSSIIVGGAGEPDTNKNPPVLHPTHASKRQSFPTGTRDAIHRGRIGQQLDHRGLIDACGDFSPLRELRRDQEFPVPSSCVVAPDYSGQPTLSGFGARAVRSKG